MWNKADEVHRLIVLRQSALDARRQAGLTGLMEGYLRMKVDIFVPRSKLESVGDLDNFLTGICDGLQAAHPRALLHPEFERSDLRDIHPRNALLLKNDSLVMEINARKLPVDEAKEVTYTVLVEELTVT